MKYNNYCLLCTDQKNLQNNSVKVWLKLLKMKTIFMNNENSKTSEPYRFRLDLSDKLNLTDPKKTWL